MYFCFIVLLLTSFMKIDVVKLLHCSIVTLHSATAIVTVLLKLETLNIKLSNLPLPFASCLLPSAFCLLPTAYCHCNRHCSFKTAKTPSRKGSSLRDSGCSKRLCIYYGFLAVF